MRSGPASKRTDIARRPRAGSRRCQPDIFLTNVCTVVTLLPVLKGKPTRGGHPPGADLLLRTDYGKGVYLSKDKCNGIDQL